MNSKQLSTTNLSRAATLSERIAAARTQGKSLNGDFDTELAQQRFKEWRSQPAFESDDVFKQRLESAGIDEDEFRCLLGQSTVAFDSDLPEIPAWMAELHNSFPGPDRSMPDFIRGSFLEALWPYITPALSDMECSLDVLAKQYSEPWFNRPEVLDIVLASLPPRISFVVERTLVLQLNVARLEDTLRGNTPAERFRDFVEQQGRRHALIDLFHEYPVLARQITVTLNQWAGLCVEILERLCQDRSLISKTFQIKDIGFLKKLNLNAGDAHRQGRSVAILEFDSGFTLVYKPKALSIDLHFQHFLQWINRKLGHDHFKAITVVDRGTHGWVEFVPWLPCSSEEEVKQFYERQGGLLALLYTLEANDFHHENLIACGANPILIDLESLFQPRLPEASELESETLASREMRYSTMRVGMLPNRLWSDEEYEGLDISGLGGAPGQPTPETPYWKDAGTDEMRLERKRRLTIGSQNRPILNDAPVDILDYTESLIAGFTEIYRFLMANRSDLLSEEGPLVKFSEDEVRVLFRPTRLYARLLYESFHPDVLSDQIDRDCLFDRLWGGVAQRPYLARLISFEQADLQNQDMPLFVSRPSSHDLWASGGQLVRNFFSVSGIDLVRDRLALLGEDDLALQIWFIKSSLTTLVMAGDNARFPRYVPISATRPAPTEKLLEQASAIGNRLEALALRGQNDATWIGMTFSGERRWSLSPLGTDLYNGLAGVALFLGYLGSFTGETRYTQLARQALVTIRHQLKQAKIKSIGAFSGWGGLLYCYSHLGSLWRDRQLIFEAEEIAKKLSPMIREDHDLDVISGVAGCIGGLLALHRCSTASCALEIAKECGDRLLHTAQKEKQGVAWPSPPGRVQPLAGFSHGAAGFAWALLRLFEHVGEQQFRSVALEAIQYERTLYSPAAENWRDLREIHHPDEEGRFVVTWCNGAPGIGLGRLCSLSHLDEQGRGELDTALKTTLNQGFGTNHSLCHGDLGNLDLLLQAAQKIDAHWKHEADLLSSAILESTKNDGCLCGVPLGVESPGLMTGLAGIGYGLLRGAFPTQIPSVLTLEPPVIGQWA